MTALPIVLEMIDKPTFQMTLKVGSRNKTKRKAKRVFFFLSMKRFFKNKKVKIINFLKKFVDAGVAKGHYKQQEGLALRRISLGFSLDVSA